MDDMCICIWLCVVVYRIWGAEVCVMTAAMTGSFNAGRYWDLIFPELPLKKVQRIREGLLEMGA